MGMKQQSLQDFLNKDENMSRPNLKFKSRNMNKNNICVRQEFNMISLQEQHNKTKTRL